MSNEREERSAKVSHMPGAAHVTRGVRPGPEGWHVDHFLQCSGCGKGCLHITSEEPLLLECCECGAVWDDGANRQCNAYGQGQEAALSAFRAWLKLDHGERFAHVYHAALDALDIYGDRE